MASKVWIVLIKSWIPAHGDAFCQVTIDGVFNSKKDAKKSTLGRIWNEWREYEIEEHEVK